jgi:hypothetical protein
MPLQKWDKGQYPEGMGPIPEDTRVEIEAIRDLLSSIDWNTIRTDPTTAVPTGALLKELSERLDIVQITCSRANSFVAQQDLEVLRQRVEDDSEDLSSYVSVAAGTFTGADPVKYLKTLGYRSYICIE